MSWWQILLTAFIGGNVLVCVFFAAVAIGVDNLLGSIDPKHITIREHMRMKRIKRKEKDNE